jgi:hypothetical protein
MKKALFWALLTAVLIFNIACNQPAAVEQAVETKLKGEHITNVDASYRDGVVILEGYVADETEHARAREIAQQTGGVKSVDDRLKVVYVPPVSGTETQPGVPESSNGNSTTQPEVDTGGALKEYKRHSNNGTQNVDPHTPSQNTDPADNHGTTNSPNQSGQQASPQPKRQK